MRKNKGFTLIEVIISITIMITILSIAYVAIRGNIKSSKHQSIVSKGQMSINTANILLTKDLEKSISVKENIDLDYNTKDEYEYSYTIVTRGQREGNIIVKYIMYDISVHNDKYDVFRSLYDENNNLISKIEVVKNQKTKNANNKPFSIIKSDNSNMHTVNLDYDEGRYNKVYSFTVDSRIIYSTNDGEGDSKPDKPDIPPEFSNKTNHVGFWIKDPSIYLSDNIGTWINNNHSKGIQDQSDEDNEDFDIYAQLRPGDKGQGENAIIDNNIIAYGDKDTIDVDKISIYVSPGTTVEDFKIKSETGSVDISVIGVIEYGTLYGGNNGRWYDCNISPNNKKVNRFSITSGELSIDKRLVDMGYLWMVYGECK